MRAAQRFARGSGSAVTSAPCRLKAMASDPNTTTAMNTNLPDSDQEVGEHVEQQPQVAAPQVAPLLTAVESFAAADTLIAEAVARSQALLHAGKAAPQPSPMTPSASVSVVEDEDELAELEAAKAAADAKLEAAKQRKAAELIIILPPR